ncbi:Exosome complex component rrp4 [Taxawa tesnikishii (nom. ined.)]|nr:Exosome complex component rrp4 [Dothideales sp. JES 119]
MPITILAPAPALPSVPRPSSPEDEDEMDIDDELSSSHASKRTPEVQSLFQDGSPSLHTRSLKYGKLRNGYFMAVSGVGGGAGVVRAKRQIFTLQTRGGEVDVVLGVNGYIWIAKHAEEAKSKDVSITRIEEQVSASMYSNQNDEISPELRREIATVAGCIRALTENGVKVEEEMIRRAYDASVEVGIQEGEEGGSFLGGERGKLVIDMALNGTG